MLRGGLENICIYRGGENVLCGGLEKEYRYGGGENVLYGGLEKEYRYRGGRAKKELKSKNKKIVMDMKKEQQNGMREKVSGKGTGKILRN